MLNPFGTSPIFAMWQGFYGSIVHEPAALHVRTTYGCTVQRVSAGVYKIFLSTGADDATVLPQLQLFGQSPLDPLYPQVVYGTGPFAQQITLTFLNLASAPEDPTGLWNFILYDGNDGIDESPGAP
jgi:hypothetical protein